MFTASGKGVILAIELPFHSFDVSYCFGPGISKSEEASAAYIAAQPAHSYATPLHALKNP